MQERQSVPSYYIATLLIFKSLELTSLTVYYMHGLLIEIMRTHFPPKYTQRISSLTLIIGYTCYIPFASITPSCLQTTLAFSLSQSVSQILPHRPPTHNSTRPSVEFIPLTSRILTSPFPHSALLLIAGSLININHKDLN